MSQPPVTVRIFVPPHARAMTIDVQVRLDDPMTESPGLAAPPAVSAGTFTVAGSTSAGDGVVGGQLKDADVDETPLGRARRLREERPSMALICGEWADQLGLPARELTRAKARGALKSTTRGRGRANRGHQITVDAMIAYLEIVDGVKRGQRTAPDWFSKVVKERGGRAA